MKFVKKYHFNQKKKDASTPIRMRIILGIILVLFSMLIIQLAYLQLGYGSRFEAEVQKTDENIVSTNVPRGVMYDSRGRVLVGNQAKNAITYTKDTSVTSQKTYTISNRLSQYISLDNEKPTSRQLYDYYLANPKNLQKETDRLTHRQRYDKSGDALPTATIYQNLLKQVSREKKHFTQREKTAALIYNKISGAYTLSTIYIKNEDLTDKEIAVVGEHLAELPGVGIGTDWTRDYPNGKSIQSIIGSVSTEKAGLPDDNLQYYLTQGYSRNDRVGTSYLEQEYESILKGSKAKSQVSVKNDNVEQTKTIYPGKTGASLILTLDAKYQQEVEAALKKVYAQAEADGAATYSSGAYAVAMNPNTGAVLAISGINHDPKTNQNTDDALGVINRSFVMGSAVKGATVAGGLMSGAITPSDSTLPDTPIYLPSTPVKKSVYPIGTFSALDAQTALEVSSNIYMMHLAMRWVKASYVPHKYISMPDDSFDILRRNFSMFGLGQKTGVDLPGESSGIKGRSFNDQHQILSGSLLDLAYGNYDAYTPIQMVQYISTIANGGYRMRPYLVKSIGETSKSGKRVSIYYNTPSDVQLSIPWTNAQLAVIKEGMYRVVHGTNAWGTAHALKDVKPSISGKTGTAETFYYDPDHPGNKNAPELINSTFVGFSPSDNPKIAVAIIFPGLDPEKEGHYALDVAKAMFTDYFNLNK